MDPTVSQVYYFGFSLLVGLVAGFLIKVYRRVLSGKRLKRGTLAVGDFLLWVILTVIAFFLFLNVNEGQIRFYELLGILIGIIAWRKFWG